MLSSRYDSAAVWLYFIPLYIVGAIVLTLALFTLVARVQGGKYALALRKAARTEREAPARQETVENFDRNALNVLLGMAYHQLNLNLQPELERPCLDRVC